MEITTASSKHFVVQYVEVLTSEKSDNRITGTLHMSCKIAANKQLAKLFGIKMAVYLPQAFFFVREGNKSIFICQTICL